MPLTDLCQCAVRDDGTVLFKFGSEAEAAAASDSASEEAQDEPAPQAATPPEAAVKSVKQEEAAQSAEQASEAPAAPGLHGFQITKPQLCALTCWQLFLWLSTARYPVKWMCCAPQCRESTYFVVAQRISCNVQTHGCRQEQSRRTAKQPQAAMGAARR